MEEATKALLWVGTEPQPSWVLELQPLRVCKDLERHLEANVAEWCFRGNGATSAGYQALTTSRLQGAMLRFWDGLGNN